MLKLPKKNIHGRFNCILILIFNVAKHKTCVRADIQNMFVQQTAAFSNYPADLSAYRTRIKQRAWRGNGKQEIERESEALSWGTRGGAAHRLSQKALSRSDNYQGRCCELGASSGACACGHDRYVILRYRSECVACLSTSVLHLSTALSSSAHKGAAA